MIKLKESRIYFKIIVENAVIFFVGNTLINNIIYSKKNKYKYF